MDNDKATCFKHDVTIVVCNNEYTVTHNDNKFPPIHRPVEDRSNTLVCVYTTETHKLKIYFDSWFAYYFIVAPEGVVMDEPCKSYDGAMRRIRKWEMDYLSWLRKHTEKGLSKKKLIDEVKTGKLQAKKIFSYMKGSPCDTEFLPLVKTKGVGSVDIIRDNRPSAVFYIDSISSKNLLYTGKQLTVFKHGYRIWNEKERECMVEWEKNRDLKEEHIDRMSDSSVQFYRKKYFFKERGCEHLMEQTYNGLVRDEQVRGTVCLVYEIQKTA